MEDKIPNQNSEKTSKKDSAINKKSNESDGQELNHQVKDKRENHQPRDTA